MNFTASLKPMPKQKLPDSEKTEEWAKNCIDAAEGLVLMYNDNIRMNRLNKETNYNLVNGVLNVNDIEKIQNPNTIRNATFPATPKNYPLVNAYLKSLLGEELHRKLDFHVAVVNPDAISSKQQQKQDAIRAKVEEIFSKTIDATPEQLQDPQFQQQIQKELQDKLDSLLEFREQRELAATYILEYFSRKLELRETFAKGFEDALIAGEEIYCVDEFNGEPTVRRCNPLMTYFLTNPHSNRIEDSDVVVEEQYIPLSEVVDRYHTELLPKDIDYLETRSGYNSSTGQQLINYSPPVTYLDYTDTNLTSNLNTSLNRGWDSNNNIRVMRIVWMSKRKINVLYYIDENGDQQKTYVDETYKPDETKGETIEPLWINEFWEGTKIANAIYVKIKPRSVQFREMNNPSICQSGYVGSVYNINSSRVQSFVDIVKPYQYLYILLMYRTELGFLKSHGKIGVLDTALIPDGMDVDKWLYYATMTGWAVQDSFKEGKKGAATGKLAGNMSGQAREMDLEQGRYIEQHISMMQYIETQVDKVTGITPQRRGQIASDAGLGTTQEAQAASATITEWYFKAHDSIKLRVLKALLETSKYCIKNGTNVFQYFMDDMSLNIFTVDPDQFVEADYGLMISDSTNDTDTLASLKRAMEMAIQTGKTDVDQLLTITSNSSMSSIRHKLKKEVAKSKEAAQQQFEAEQQTKQKEIEASVKLEQDKLALEYEKLNREDMNKQLDRENKIELETLKAYALDEGSNIENIAASSEQALKQQDLNLKHITEANKLAVQERHKAMDTMLKEKELMMKKQIEDKKIDAIRVQNRSQELMQDKQIKLKEKELAAKEKIERIKLRAKPKK
jgi:hypothetical protein